MRVQGNAGAVNISANPQIAAGQDGQVVIIQGKSNVNTVLFEDDNGLALSGGVSFTMGDRDTITFVYDAGDGLWIEIARSDK